MSAADRIPGGHDQASLTTGIDLAFNTSAVTGIEAIRELGVHEVSEKQPRVSINQNNGKDEINQIVVDDEETFEDGKGMMTAGEKVNNMEEIGIHALHVEDDPSLNPWTFRTVFLGM